MPFKVTPWEVEGKVDYDKLTKEFGTKPIDAPMKARLERLAGGSHVFLRRNFFFSHRDLDMILKDHEAGKGFFLYTGRGPSGKMHVGHLIPLVFTKWLQEKFKVNVYIEITDDEKFLFRPQMGYDDVQKQADEDILEIAALGFDPERTFIFKDTEFIKQLYPLALKVAKRINLSTSKAVFGFSEQSNTGMIFYPAIQAVPTFFEKKRCLIPAAIDQDNYWRIQRDIAESLGFYKTAAIHSKLFVPLTGLEGKMSSSVPQSAILLSDDEKTVRDKVMKHAFSGGGGSLKEHRERGGNPDVDVAFQWLKMFFEEDDRKLNELESGYRSGSVTTGEMKEHLIKKLTAFLEQHRKQRKSSASLAGKLKYDGRLAKQMWEKTF